MSLTIITPTSLDALVHARIDAVSLTAETGLVCVSLWSSAGAVKLSVGLGPAVSGLGFAHREPVFRASTHHPLIAASRAHLVGHRVRHVAYEPDLADLWLSVGSDGAIARLRLRPGVHGEAEVYDLSGSRVVHWRAEASRAPCTTVTDEDPSAAGDVLVRVSDALAAELRRGVLLKALDTYSRRLARRAEAVTEDLSRLDNVEVLQRTGRLLLAQGAKIPRGATHYTLDDWETGGELEVTLDPARPAKTQAEEYFHKARKIQRGEAVMWARLETTEHTRAEVRALTETVRETEEVTLSVLEAWSDRAYELGVPRARTETLKKRAKPVQRKPFIEYTGAYEQVIYVGRGAADNDALTLRVARPRDLWLHARGVPGAHVVVPLAKGEQCRPEVLIDAATLAAHHSDLRGESVVDVTVAERRYVRKPRGSAVGEVTVDRERVIALRVEPERLARLLSARREER